MKKYAVILAGGVGERFWPLSRKDTPKYLWNVADGGDRLVTIGIAPAYPATGFGYIRRGREYGTPSDAYYKAARFCEKPDLKKAQKFLADGGYFWNAGIFVWKVSSVLGAIEKTSRKHTAH